MGIDELITALEDAATKGNKIEKFVFPMNEASKLDRLYKNAVVSDVEYLEDGIHVKAIVDEETRGALRQYIVGYQEEEDE